MRNQMERRLRNELDKAKQDPKHVAMFFTDKGFALCVDAYMEKSEILEHFEAWWTQFGQIRYEKNKRERK